MCKTYKSLLRGIHFRYRKVMVDEFGPICLQLDGRPHHWVEVGKVMVHVDAFIAETTQSPTCQLRALQVTGKGNSSEIKKLLQKWFLIQFHLHKTRDLFIRNLISIWIHGGQKMDASLFDQMDDALVFTFIFLTHVLHQIEHKFPTQHFVPMHPRHIPKLWFSCRVCPNRDTGHCYI